MNKYFKIFQITLSQFFVYRLSFILWRVRNIFNLFFLYFLWSSVFNNKTILFSYTQEKLIAYIMLINILSSLVLGTRTTDVANDILTGDIANYFLKPISFFKFLIAKEVADKFINFVFSVLEVILLLFIFKPHIFIQTNPLIYGFFVCALIIGITISFLISLCLSLMAFWSSETWAPRFIYFILVSMLAGTLFPLDILPKTIYNLLLFTPFPYLIFLPSKIFTHGFSFDLLISTMIGIAWAVFLFYLTKIVWDKGIKNYSAYGR